MLGLGILFSHPWGAPECPGRRVVQQTALSSTFSLSGRALGYQAQGHSRKEDRCHPTQTHGGGGAQAQMSEGKSATDD